MPSLDVYRRKLSVGSGNPFPTPGIVHHDNANMMMEATWDNDIQSRRCYIYDYYHDDDKAHNKDMTYEDTTKTPIDVKFEVSQYQTLAKDRVEYHIMFRPSQPLRFEEEDELYYYEEDFVKKYGAEFPIGLYIDIPDENGVYHKWLICMNEIGNQFPKYSVLPCNYYYHWVEYNGNERIKRKMWGVSRAQNSYNSGLWRDYLFTATENQSKLWLPMNSITEKLYYTANIGGTPFNQRIVVSARTETPTVWQISKVENADPFGLQRLTLKQDRWNDDTDFIDTDDPDDLFAMYANYYISGLTPVDVDEDKKPTCTISYTSHEIKVNGSYRTFTASVFDRKGNDITDAVDNITWSIHIGDIDAIEQGLVNVINGDQRIVKVKFLGDRSYITKVLTIEFSCNYNDNPISASADLAIVAI